MSKIILGIESSCDDTSAAVIKDGILLSNLIANQDVHVKYGGVVPELASRAHQQNIIPVVAQTLKNAGIEKEQVNAVAFTRGPGLMGSLLVGASFAKGFALSRNIPLIAINHLQAHVLAIFLKEMGVEKALPSFPFLCLLVSGGHSQIIIVKDYLDMEIIGQTIDDAAGEAFDKCAKVLGLPYPGGPHIDKLAGEGDENKYVFSRPRIPGFDYSFSGLKTSFLYFLRDKVKGDDSFVNKNLKDIAASLQYTIIEILLEKLNKAVKETGIKRVALAGGVSANSGLRIASERLAHKEGWSLFLPERKFTTDNAAMIAITGYYKYLAGEFADHQIVPLARM
ncbi:MAG: tRNA (adenosine(37)-N6)-threonylcarbamoyltransferase complex transferase subunit TsaD [Bacteroidales bacterium]|nr:tRNA (adenosine(37)-N6)-threonylcarbamoyltransferase complex transferase subunit TsaD [Bacteroidales bacterium]